jgi:riboflavin kinase/FMN adenylyltransferase
MTNAPKYVATIGMFDGVHRGHQALLAWLNDYARAHSLAPMVVTFTPHPMAVVCPAKAPQLLTSYDDRRRLIEQQLDNGTVVELNFDQSLRTKTAAQFMQLLHDEYNVTALIMGYNHHFGSDGVREFEQYQALGAACGIEVIREQQMCDNTLDVQISSSSVRGELQSGDIATANRLLGRPYTLQGKVVSGKHLGRTIGFPTANLQPDKQRLVPAPGVYAAATEIDGTRYAAMVNIGTCPTVSTGSNQTIEVNIIDWTGDLYSASLTIQFIAHLRTEQKFDSLDALQAQLTADRLATLAAYGSV